MKATAFLSPHHPFFGTASPIPFSPPSLYIYPHSSSSSPLFQAMSSARDPKPPVAMGYPAAPPPRFSHHPTVATAYPYPAPPPPPSYRGPSYGIPASPNTRLLRHLLAGAVAFFLLIGATIFILWLVLRPRLPQFSVTSASVSAFNLSYSRLSADFDLAFAVRNPNQKLAVYYNPVLASVIYAGDEIAGVQVPPFYQGTQNVTALRARPAVASEYVDADVARGIAAERARGNGAVGFDARLVIWVGFKAGGWRTRWRPMTVYCKGIQMGFANATADVGSMVGPPKMCHVNL